MRGPRSSRHNKPCSSSPGNALDVDPMLCAQIAHELIAQIVVTEVLRFGELFGGAIEAVEIIAARLHPVTHIVIGQTRRRRLLIGHALLFAARHCLLFI